MNTAAHMIDTCELIDVYADAGMLPADYDDQGQVPAWVAKSRYDAVMVVSSTSLLVARQYDESIYIARLTMSGCISAEVRFDAPNCEISELNLAGVAAILTAWSK